MTETPNERTLNNRIRGMWDTRAGGIGLLMGLLPHILHHVGFFVGTVLIAGSGGTAIFGALGFLLSVPMLIRLHKRFGTWHAPAIALLIFATMFALSAFLIGPAMNGGALANPTSVSHSNHGSHH